jgi:hypothetical protein
MPALIRQPYLKVCGCGLDQDLNSVKANALYNLAGVVYAWLWNVCIMIEYHIVLGIEAPPKVFFKLLSIKRGVSRPVRAFVLKESNMGNIGDRPLSWRIGQSCALNGRERRNEKLREHGCKVATLPTIR